jgi:two-component system response regulator HydG
MKKILIIDDDTFICDILEKLLKDNGFDTEVAFSAATARQKLKGMAFDLVLCDYRLPDSDGLEMLKTIKNSNPESNVIIITAYADVRLAVKLMKAGAKDYITKPLHQDELLHLIKKITTDKKTTDSDPDNQFIIGDSQKFKEVIKMADLVANTNMSVLLTGETGSGKEYVARSIHLKSKRKKKPFIAVDCGAIPKDLANSELFGHIKGSFTGAVNDKKGVFEAANGGTLFLDEIGNLTLDIQVRLLRVLQERVITRVGDTKNIEIDVRIIAASNEDMFESVKEGNFREDLYHRLNEFKIHIPPLRERREDIIIFANFFMHTSNNELGKNVDKFDASAIEVMQNYPWYGNLRELKNVIKRSVLLAQSDTISVDHFPDEIKNLESSGFPDMNIHLADGGLKEASHEAEKKLILDTLSEVNYNKTKAAKKLNIDRKTLYNKIKQYNIDLNTISSN